jgi:Na+/H+-dicarboxylate symporter
MKKHLSRFNWFKYPMWQKILIALILGIVAGLVFKEKILVIKPIGDMFIRGIHMIIVPVLFFSIINAFLSVNDVRSMRRIAFKAIGFYVLCMLVAATMGILAASLLMPGKGLQLVSTLATNTAAPAMLNWQSFFENLIPDNPIQAFSSGNVIQILVFAIFFGIAMNRTQEHAVPVAQFCRSCFNVVIKLALLVMSFAPYGIFALIASVVGQYGVQALIPLLKFIASVYLGCFGMLAFYGIVLYFMLGVSPRFFFKGILTPLLTAYTTSSSAATMPVTLKSAEEKLGIKPLYTRFLIPLGISLNLNGLSVYLSAATVFAANIYGVHLGVEQYSTMLFIIVLTAMGAAAVPGSALVVMGAVQTAVGIPLGALPLIAGVDRFNDMMQTATNVAGDLFTTLVVSNLDHASDREVLPASAEEG